MKPLFIYLCIHVYKDNIIRSSEDENDENLSELVIEDIWCHLNCYMLPEDDGMTRWFLMDEGS